MNFLGGGELLPSGILMDILSDLVCDSIGLDELCESIFFILCGFDEAQMNMTMIDTLLHHVPAGTSTNTLVHYAQCINAKKFQYYDYGSKAANNEHYGQATPPEYQLEKITIPIASYWSLNDWLAHPIDVLKFHNEIPNLFDNYEVPFPEWNHLDFLWGIDAHDLVYSRVMENLEKFRKIQ